MAWSGRVAQVNAVIGEITRVAKELGQSGGVLLAPSAQIAVGAQRSGDLLGVEAQVQASVAELTALGPYALILRVTGAVSQAERGDLDGALSSATQASQAFPSTNHWAGWVAGCELWCMALLEHPDWSRHYRECEHFLPIPGNASFAGRRLFAIFLVLAHVARRELEAAAALYPVLCQILDDDFRVWPFQTVEGLVGLAAAAGGHWDIAEGHFRSALAFVDQIGDRLGKPAVQKWYAWMLLRRDSPGDREQARVLLDDAIASFGAMGMTVSLGEAEAMRASLDS